MNKLDLVVADEIIPPVENFLEQFFETGKVLIRSNSNGIIDAIEALRLKRHEQNFRKLLDYLDNTQELKDFISKSDKKQKEFLVQVLIKTASLENDIQIFIMSRIVQNMKQYGKLDYYESSLFANINSLTTEDFECFYDIWRNKIETDKSFYHYNISQNQSFYIDSQRKMFNIGILREPRGTQFGASSKEDDIKLKIFYETDITDNFFLYLKEYFESENNKQS
jgi:hypothetical protein